MAKRLISHTPVPGLKRRNEAQSSLQGMKLGKLLFEQAIRAIKELHPLPCQMRLNVNRQNKALTFYQKMGMTKVDEGDFPIGHGFYMNDYIMGLDI